MRGSGLAWCDSSLSLGCFSVSFYIFALGGGEGCGHPCGDARTIKTKGSSAVLGEGSVFGDAPPSGSP